MPHANLPKILQPFRCDDLIRLGSNDDGGYLVNQYDILKTNTLISFGIGEDWSFENNFVEHNNCKVYGYDGTIETPEDYSLNNKEFINKNVGRRTTDKQLSVSSILESKEDVFLKCDIEGSEYEILEDLIKHSHIFTGMVIEFHDTNLDKNLDNIVNFIAKIGLRLVHVHINNWYYLITPYGIIPTTLEITFSSSNNLVYDTLLSLPHRLDMPNNPLNDQIEVNYTL
jgi:hypothetical protein